MDELCSAAKQYVDILKLCSSPEVKSWRKEDLSRALQWCKYFNEVNVRIAKKRSVVQTFDEKLRSLGFSMAFRCGGEGLTAHFLSRSSEYLIKALVENPALPAAVLDDLQVDGFSFEQHIEQLSKDRVLLNTLQTMHSRLVNLSSRGGDLVLTDARCLYEELQWCLQSPTPKDTVCRRLESLSQEEGGLITTLQTFLIAPEGQVGVITINWVLQLLRSWEVPTTNSKRSTFWRDSPHQLLAEVSSHSDEFCDQYLTFLGHWMELLMTKQHLSNSEDCGNLIGHFRTLALSSPKMKDICIQALGSHVNLSSVLQCSTSGPRCQSIWDQLMAAVTSSAPLCPD